jgi:hypothetical protein
MDYVFGKHSNSISENPGVARGLEISPDMERYLVENTCKKAHFKRMANLDRDVYKAMSYNR